MRILVDTSALIALLDEDDLRHREASAMFRSLARTADLVTHNYIHVEAIAVARRRLGPEAAARLADDLLPAMATIWVDELLHHEALSGHRAGSGSASLVDHVSFTVMRRLGIEVAFAFDADFDSQGFSRPTAGRSDPERPRISETPAAYSTDREVAADVVSVSEIAARTGRPINTIQSWRRRHRDFPTPMAQLAAGPVWAWTPVRDWIESRDGGRTSDRRRATAQLERLNPS